MVALTRIGALTEAETRAVAEFETQLHNRLPGRVRSLILFGSKARGDAHPESDIDLLVVVDESDYRAREAIAAAEWAIFEKTGVTLEPHVYGHAEVELFSQRLETASCEPLADRLPAQTEASA